MKKLKDINRGDFINCVASNEDTLESISDIIIAMEGEITEQAKADRQDLFSFLRLKIGSPHQEMDGEVFWNFEIKDVMYGLCIDEDGFQILCEENTIAEDMFVALSEIKEYFNLETPLAEEKEAVQFVYSIEQSKKETRIIVCQEDFWEEHGQLSDYLMEEGSITLIPLLEELQAVEVTATIFSSPKSLPDVQKIIDKYNFMNKSESFDEYNEIYI